MLISTFLLIGCRPIAISTGPHLHASLSAPSQYLRPTSGVTANPDDVWRRSAPELLRLWDVKTGIDIPEFRRLSVGCISVERDYVLDGLEFGFPLGVNPAGPFPPPRLWAESRVSPAGRLRINDYLLSERSVGRIYGPLPVPRGDHWRSSVVYPMCEALRSDGRYRTISNLSYSSPLNSVNGFIPDSESETEYPSFLEVASAIVSIGLNDVFFSLFDVHSAYRNLRIACADWRFSIIAWKNLTTGQREFWLDVALVFGGKSGCRIYNRFGGVLAYILRTHGFLPAPADLVGLFQCLVRYLDDHLLMARSLEAVLSILDRMLTLMAHLGVPVKEVKTIRGASEIKFLGYLWSPRLNLVSLDAARWATVESDLRVLIDLLRSNLATAHDIRCVTGLLVWASKVIPTGRIFTRGLHQVLRLCKATSLPAAQARRIRVSDPLQLDLALVDLYWWLDLCVAFRFGNSGPIGISITGVVTPKVWAVADCSLVFHCDASGKGIAGFMAGSPAGLHWVFTPLPRGITLSWSRPKGARAAAVLDSDDPESVSSGYCEAAGLYLSLLTFLPIWAAAHPEREAGAGVWAYSDSQVVVDMWSAKKSCDTMLPYLRQFAHLEALYSITLIVSHIPGKLNTTADALSRQEFAKFRALQPQADAISLPLPSVLTFFL